MALGARSLLLVGCRGCHNAGGSCCMWNALVILMGVEMTGVATYALRDVGADGG